MMRKYIYVNVDDLENIHNGEIVKIKPELSEDVIADNVIITFDNGDSEYAYSSNKISVIANKEDVKKFMRLIRSLELLKSELTPIVSDISLKLDKYEVYPNDWEVNLLEDKIIAKAYDWNWDETYTWEFPVSYLYDKSWYLDLKKKENEEKLLNEKAREKEISAIKRENEEYQQYLRLKEKFEKSEANDKSVCFLKVIREIDEAIRNGFLQRDPKNENHIFIYRKKGDVNPEGWYSENILEVASELVNDKEGYESFKNELANVRKEIEQESKR